MRMQLLSKRAASGCFSLLKMADPFLSMVQTFMAFERIKGPLAETEVAKNMVDLLI